MYYVGAAVTAAAGIVFQISSQLDRGRGPDDDDDDDANSKHKQQKSIGNVATAVHAPRAAAAAAAANTTTMLPLLPTRIYQPNDNLTIAFDTRSKNPLFVMERLTNNDARNRINQRTNTTTLLQEKDDDNNDEDISSRGAIVASRKNKRFHEEQSLLPYHRSRNQYYRNSGYDRGHLAPAADFACNDKEMNDTFVLTNASPQLPRFNRSIWLKLEEFVRKVASGKRSSASTTYTETWVITGPLWLPSSVKRHDSGDEGIFHYSYEGIGKPPSLIAVPTHFYKVVVVIERPSSSTSSSSLSSTKEKESVDASDVGATLSTTASIAVDEEMTLREFAAFVVPNADNMGNNTSFRLVDHIVRLTDLEAVSGLEFFPALFGTNLNSIDANNSDANSLQKEIADALTDDVRLRGHTTDKRRNNERSGNESSSSLVPLSGRDVEEYSKGRRKKIQQILKENSSIPFQHLCEKNELCYQILRV
ncbi:hypothetical protein ACHAWU_008057 [Discostella pseudostelligera]|uniref:Endonuclease n=1 Tax=Discostella pseudostelligera TaxID=259834 RepID=A0ABD3NGF7_9STRA